MASYQTEHSGAGLSWLDDVDDGESGGFSPAYYQYESLPPRTIRVIDLHRGFGRLGLKGALEMDMQQLSLDDETPFMAMSYTWGPPSLQEKHKQEKQIFTVEPRCHPVVCNGMLVRVTQSLRDLLIRLRAFKEPDVDKYMEDLWKTKIPRYVWADGICINQDNLDERASQVALMGDVYRKASKVIVWIGEPDQAAEVGLEIVQSLAQKALAPSQEDFDETVRGLKWEHMRISPTKWRHWVVLMSREWFQRTWVVQEAALAGTQKVELMCGSKCFQLAGLLLGTTLTFICKWNIHISSVVSANFSDDPEYQELEPIIQRWLLATHPFTWLRNIWAALEVDGEKPPFHNICKSIFQFTQCSDPRDKIYGTLGIVAEFDDCGTGLPGTLQVDYNKPVADVFHEATKHALKRSRSLRMLCLVFDGTVKPFAELPNERDTPGLATWCPDYDAGYRYPNLLMEGLRDDQIEYDAARGSIYTPSVRQVRSDQLALTGVKYGVVHRKTSLVKWMLDYSVFNEIVLLILEALRSRNLEGIHLEPASDVFWKTLICSEWSLSDEDRSPELDLVVGEVFTMMLTYSVWDKDNDLDFLPAQVQRCRDTIEEITAVEGKRPRCLPDMQAVSNELTSRRRGTEVDLDWDYMVAAARVRQLRRDLLADPKHLPSLQSKMASKTAARCLLLTEGPNCTLGLSHSCTQPGDEVWLLSGSKVPFILRPTDGDDMELVGEAYIHGIMLGEAWPEDKSLLKTITLR